MYVWLVVDGVVVVVVVVVAVLFLLLLLLSLRLLLLRVCVSGLFMRTLVPTTRVDSR